MIYVIATIEVKPGNGEVKIQLVSGPSYLGLHSWVAFTIAM